MNIQAIELIDRNYLEQSDLKKIFSQYSEVTRKHYYKFSLFWIDSIYRLVFYLDIIYKILQKTGIQAFNLA